MCSPPGAAIGIDRRGVARHRRQQGGAAARILGAHAADMRRQQALAHELGKRRLVQRVDAAIHQRADAHERRHQRRGHHGKAEAQRRSQRLAERAAVDHPSGAIERGQRRQRMAAPAELGIAVVLQHPGIGAGRPVKQRQTPADRQRAAKRRGMGRRHKRQPSVGRDAGSRRRRRALRYRWAREPASPQRRAARHGRRCSPDPRPRRHRPDRAAVRPRCAAPAGCRR